MEGLEGDPPHAIQTSISTAAEERRRSDCRYVVWEEITMLFALAMILLIAWALGLGGVYAIGSIVHVLLVIAIVLFLVGLIAGRETVV
jgi:uncharacterized membrane protein YtjA (UPF0391 family)